MTVPSGAGVARRRLLAALLALAMIVAAGARAGDADAHGAAPSRSHAAVHVANVGLAAVTPSAAASFAASFPSFELAGGDVAKVVCGLLGKPVKAGVAGFIRLLTKGAVRGTLAGTLAAEIGFNPWCSHRYAALRRRLKAVADAKPKLTPRIGPFVFNVVPRYQTLSGLVDRIAVSWTELSLSSPLRFHFVWYRVNQGRWTPISGTTVNILRGVRAQFAVRVDNRDGASSPYAYSADYLVP
jgi:hypothetical protein